MRIIGGIDRGMVLLQIKILSRVIIAFTFLLNQRFNRSRFQEVMGGRGGFIFPAKTASGRNRMSRTWLVGEMGFKWLTQPIHPRQIAVAILCESKRNSRLWHRWVMCQMQPGMQFRSTTFHERQTRTEIIPG